ncbi:multiple epidermal growth factor-like domains protein 10 [Saccostrea cucullata]|uniref:multiple epidermal growth factor-like domains protein 10 n=1 Tax=Saccostrea cuccullata TaxID=36930 RepID=UPI002ED464A8
MCNPIFYKTSSLVEPDDDFLRNFRGHMTSKPKCEDGTFGPGCIHKCSGNCRDESQCNKATGVCDFGCSPGYTDPFCNTACVDGKFGIQCKEACSGHCLNLTKCNHIDGSCSKGCENGYTGDRCNNPCEDGLFGVNCSQICPINCQQSQKCNNRDGSCICSPGWTGQHCNKECEPGFYGQNCLSICRDYCLNGTCNRTDGSCLAKCSNGTSCKKGGEPSVLLPIVQSSSALTVGGVLGAFAVVIIIVLLTFLYLR